jgi:hypothetical protein
VNLYIIGGLAIGILSGIFVVYTLRPRRRAQGRSPARQSFGCGRLLFIVALFLVVVVILYAAQGAITSPKGFSLPRHLPLSFDHAAVAFLQAGAGYAGGIIASALGGFLGMLIYDRWKAPRKS